MKNNNMRATHLDKEVYELYKSRNERIVSFFYNVCDMNVDLISKLENPRVAYMNKCLNCFVNNFELVLYSKKDVTDKSGVEFLRINLAKPIDEDEKDEIRSKIVDWLQMYHQRLYCIRLNCNTPMYLAGYDFIDRQNKETSYPIFSAYGYKRYFTREKAEEVVEQFYLQDHVTVE